MPLRTFCSKRFKKHSKYPGFPLSFMVSSNGYLYSTSSSPLLVSHFLNCSLDQVAKAWNHYYKKNPANNISINKKFGLNQNMLKCLFSNLLQVNEQTWSRGSSLRGKFRKKSASNSRLNHAEAFSDSQRDSMDSKKPLAKRV